MMFKEGLTVKQKAGHLSLAVIGVVLGITLIVAGVYGGWETIWWMVEYFEK